MIAGRVCRSRWVLAVLALLCLGAGPAAHAADDRFVVRTAYTELLHGVYFLNADMHLALDRQAVDALVNGVPLVLKIQIQLSRERSLLWDAAVADLTQSYQLTYHALSRRYIVKNLNSGFQVSFQSYQDALDHLGHINDLPIIDGSLLNPDDRYDIRIRVLLDIKNIPTGFQLITSLFSGTEQSSDWYQWVLHS